MGKTYKDRKDLSSRCEKKKKHKRNLKHLKAISLLEIEANNNEEYSQLSTNG